MKASPWAGVRRACAVAALVWPAASSAQGGNPLLDVPMFQACAASGCQRPPDPASRDGFLLRLSGTTWAAGMPSWVDRGGDKQSKPSKKPEGAVPPSTLAFMQAVVGARPADGPPQRNAVAARAVLEGRYAEARTSLEAARDAAGDKDPLTSAAVIANLGVVSAAEGRFDSALREFEAALKAFEALDAKNPVPSAPPPARVPAKPSVAEYQAEAMRALNPATAMNQFPHHDLLAASAGVLRTQLNLANVYGQLGQFTTAKGWVDKAWERVVARGEGGTQQVLGDYLALYRYTRNSTQTAETLRRLRAQPAVSMLDVGMGPHLEVGFIPLSGKAVVQSPQIPLGGSSVLVAPAEADPSPSLPGANRAAEAEQRELQQQAATQEQQGNILGALQTQGRLALLGASTGNIERERSAYAALQRLAATRGDMDQAILHGKRAVNATQTARTALGAMDRQSRQAFLAGKRQSYVALVQALLDRRRLAEAEHVLRLMKEDEGQQLRQVSGAARGRIPYTTAESAAQTPRASIAMRARKLESERAELIGPRGEAVQASEFDALDRRLTDDIAALEKRFDSDERVLAGQRPDATASGKSAIASALASRMMRTMLTGPSFLGQAIPLTIASARALHRDIERFGIKLDPARAARVEALQGRANRAEVAWKEFAGKDADSKPDPNSPTGLLLTSMRELETPQKIRLATIERELASIETERAALDAKLSADLRASRSTELAPADRELVESGQQLLRALPAGTVAVYYLSGADRLDALLVTREGRRHWRVPVARAALEKQITEFRKLLQSPRSNPQPLARALHDTLVAPPLAQALSEARASTVMLSLDGALRYLPFAALHDGRSWMAERFALSLYTSAAPEALKAKPARPWRVAAFGATEGGQGMSPLPGVKEELELIVRNGSAGVLDGTLQLNRNFTEQTLLAALRDHRHVVHIASHFAFSPGDAAGSFLLLGDGNGLNLTRLNGPEYRFDEVDLVTLSACETGLSGDDAFGQEIEGLGTLLQGQGAAAVLATLWQVADDGTAQFMHDFYAAREAGALSRAEALRAAQAGFISGRPVLSLLDVAGRGGRITAVTLPQGAAPAPPGALRPKSFSHPFYWAPFVLMGNWL